MLPVQKFAPNVFLLNQPASIERERGKEFSDIIISYSNSS